MTNIHRKGVMLIISSPSGAGKTTLAHALIKSDPNMRLSVSVTTRPKRKNEVHGKDYYFISREEFDDMLSKNLLLEHAEVFGYHYGTPLKQTQELLEKGMDIVYDIDWQGALQLIKTYKENIASIFILPPSMKILEERLQTRNMDDHHTIQKRLKGAKEEISKCHYYDYIIVNHDLNHSLHKLKSCLEAERNRKSRLLLSEFLLSLNLLR